MTAKTVLVIAPGSFTSPRAYGATIAQINATIPPDQLEVHMYDLPTAARALDDPSGAATLYEDASFLRAKVQALINEGKDVVLMGYSYGGMVVTQTMQGLPVKKRGDDKPGVRTILYLTALVPRIGDNVGSLTTEGAQLSFMQPKPNTDFLFGESQEAAATVTWNDEPLERALEFSQLMNGHHSAFAFSDAITYEGWRDVPSVGFIVAEKDRLFSEWLQREWIGMLKEQKGDEHVKVASIPGSHGVPFNHPELVAGAIKKLLEATVEE